LCKASCAVFEPGDHASTFGGNPFACKVGLTVCETLEAENLLDNVKQRGEQLRFGLQRLVQQYPALLEQVRGWGLINGLVLQPDSTIKSVDIVKAAMDEGLLLVPAGSQVVRFVPPLNVSADEVQQALVALEKALAILIERQHA
ncbi:MAG: aminotransferase class III-fold pyridoxal phosphate-dependent enzyme, partial [Nodosilinea sp.]